MKPIKFEGHNVVYAENQPEYNPLPAFKAENGTIRIADHEGRSKLKYKYNIMLDGNFGRPKWVKDDGRWRCFAHAKCYLDLCLLIVQQSEKVKSYADPKFSYTIPKFKQK